MKITIVGCGKTGSNIAERLSNEKHDVTVIDSNPDKINDITNRLDVMGIVGNGASYKVLKEAGADESDLIVAATNQDEINLLCCLFARQAAHCSTIARVRNPQYRDEISFIKEELGLSLTINPDYDAAQEIARVLRFPSATKIDTFAKGRVELIRVRVDEFSAIANKTLIDIAKMTKASVLIGLVERGEDVIIPNGRFEVRAGDTIGVLATPQSARQFFNKIGYDTHQVKDCIIIGGGRMGYYLASSLINSGVAVKIVDRDRKKCEELSVSLPKASIIFGDATDESIMMEEGITSAESVVSLTDMDEGNIFLSLYAKKVSKAKVVTKINHLDLNDIVKNFNLGSIITPKNISADMVVSYVRARQNTIGSNVETLYRLVENKVEALEFKINAGSPVIGIPIQELQLKENLLIGCVSNDESVSIVNGSTIINEGDTVVVITTNEGLKDIKDILKN